METSLFDFIRNLSIHDKKSLAEKTLKTSEESGELAKAVLSHQGAYATAHRFTTSEKVLQEACDTILAALSIPYSLGYTDEQILDMLKQKSEYWAELQAKQDRINFPVPFEIHVTIKFPPDIEHFKFTCQKLGVKPIILDLENYTIDLKDVMTSSVVYSDNIGAYNEVKRISDGLRYAGYLIVREKIETIPVHPAAPRSSDKNPKMPDSCYFESHLSIKIGDDEKKYLQDITEKHGAHLSRNFFKKINIHEYIIMTTLRSYEDTYEKFLERLKAFKAALINGGFNPEKEIVEFSIYDTKISHDFIWLNKLEQIAEKTD